MTIYLATADRLSDIPSLKSLTPQGWSAESKTLRAAQDEALRDYFDALASRPNVNFDDECNPALRLASEELLSILDAFKGRLPVVTTELLRNRLDVILDPTDWESGDELPNPESFRRMLSFLSAHKELRHPSIFLNRYGLFTASWRPEKRKLTSIVFQDDDTANWLVFLPRPDSPDDTVETAGRIPLTDVLRAIRQAGGQKWMRRPSLVGRLLGDV